MADAVWPATLPPPRTASLRERLPDLTVRTRMAVGPDKVRRRASVGTRQFDVELDLTAAQFATLASFYLDTLEGGALTFEWTDPRTGDDPTEFRFLGAPSCYPREPRKSAGADKWRASFPMEQIPAASDEVVGVVGDSFPDAITTLVVAAGLETEGGGAEGIQLWAVPDEDDPPPPEFLLEAIQVIVPQETGDPFGSTTSPVPAAVGGGGDHGPPSNSGAIGVD